MDQQVADVSARVILISLFIGPDVAKVSHQGTIRTRPEPAVEKIVLDFSYVLEVSVLPQNGNNVI
jgi:hypothetical protein